MQNNNNSSPVLLETVLQRIFSIRTITKQDKHLLMSSLFLKEGLDDHDRKQIGRVFEGLLSGFIKAVD